MKWSLFGRVAMALMSAVGLGLSMTACGGGTIAYIWATGTTAQGPSQVAGYMVDDYTGNLTAIPGQPFSSADSNPVQVLVRPGGRFLYVINQGTGYTTSSNGTGSGIDLFAIGGEGTLTFEQHYDTQGYGHLWAAFDGSGANLFVLDKYSPAYQSDTKQPSFDVNGAITTFTSDPTNGRLVVVGQNASTQPGQAAPKYLEVGVSPRRMVQANNCLFTLNDVGQTVTAYSANSGQLGTVTTGVFPLPSISASSITGNGQFVFVTDTENNSNPGQIFTFTVTASTCALTALNPGAVTPNDAAAFHPNNAFVSNSGRYVYILNGLATNTASTTSGSLLTAYSTTTGQLEPVTGQPFVSGPAPQCMVEDPTFKFVYVANAGDGTITGYQYSDTNGTLAGLQRGSSFQTSLHSLSCLAISGVV